MRIAIKFFRVDAVLHQHELDVGDVQVRFLLDFAA
jgi:hypothetical protein